MLRRNTIRGNGSARRASLLAAAAALLFTLVNLPVAATTPVSSAGTIAQQGKVDIKGVFSVDPARQGSTFRAAIVMDIPKELHVNSNKPLGKYAVPTRVTVDAPRGLKITPVTYPRGKVRSFPFAPDEKLAVYEGQTIMRFNVSVPSNYERGVARVKVTVNYQSCSDDVCFPPRKQELTLPIAIVGPNDKSNNINGKYFGGRK